MAGRYPQQWNLDYSCPQCREDYLTYLMGEKPGVVAAFHRSHPEPPASPSPGPTPMAFWECWRCRQSWAVYNLESVSGLVRWEALRLVALEHEQSHQSPPPASD